MLLVGPLKDWQPIAFNVWTDTVTGTWVMDDWSVAPHVIAQKLSDSDLNIKLQKASEHYNGKGIQNGMDWEISLSLTRALNKPDQYNHKCTIDTIMCGATWPNSRVHEAFPDVSERCVRCGAERDCAFHCFWECPANENISSDAIQKTQYLRETAKTKIDEEPCLWLRGLLPSHFTQIEPEFLPREDLFVVSTNPDKIIWEDMKHGTFYGDASGGIFSSMPRIRRIGCGIVQIDHTGELIWGQHFNLPGTIQTVPRGELFALLYLVERLEPFANVTYVTDNEKVSEIYNNGKEAALKSTNCDLFKDIFRLIECNFLKIQVRWMPSHLDDEDERLEGVSLIDIKGNRHADVQAGKAAHYHAVPVNVSSTHIYYYSLTRKIQI